MVFWLGIAMKMDLNAIIEKMETGDQDAALTALQIYNKEVNISILGGTVDFSIMESV